MNFREPMRFAAVGVAQSALNVGIFAGLVAGGVWYGLAAGAAFSVALIVSFILNRRWTFTASAGRRSSQLLRYAQVYMAASAGGVVLLALFVEVLGWAPVPSQVAAIFIVAPLSYLGQRAYAFRVRSMH